MQTSFMHPPFGFAQFYFRGIAPKEVKSNDIYLGAIPWVFMQLILAAVLIFYPGRVTMWLDKDVKYDLDKIKIELPTDDPAAKQPATPPAGGPEKKKLNGNMKANRALKEMKNRISILRPRHR